MLKIEIHECTPHNMLRAIRAACNELLGEQSISVGVDLAPGKDQTGIAAMIRSAGGPVEGSQFYRVGEQPSEQTILAAAFDKAVETVGAPAVAAALVNESAEELDSAGHAWNAELHASTKSKNADGTWKKRRGAAQVAEAAAAWDAGIAAQTLPPGGQVPTSVPDAPPLPPAAPSAPLVTMNDLYALVTNGKRTINELLAAAHADGFTDLGAFSQQATPEQRAEMLRKLESA